MNSELIISSSFMVAIIIEAIILLKNFFTTTEKEFLSKSLFRFLSNSFIYVAALLIFISSFSQQSGLEIINFKNLNQFTLGQAAIWSILIADVVTLIVLGIGIITNVFKKKDKQPEETIIDQKKARELA
ncbi:hypothetical protein JCM16358_02100 [Halanaerocella petrolearia]